MYIRMTPYEYFKSKDKETIIDQYIQKLEKAFIQ